MSGGAATDDASGVGALTALAFVLILGKADAGSGKQGWPAIWGCCHSGFRWR